MHGAALEQITISDGQKITTDSTGKALAKIDVGTLTFTGSVSGKSFTRVITADTTDVYVMPEGFVLYWYGYNNEDINFVDHTIGIGSYSKGNLTINTNNFILSYTSYCVNCRPTNGTIAFSNYNKLHYIGYETQGSAAIEFLDTNTNSAKAAATGLAANSSTVKEWEYDISSLNIVSYLAIRSTHRGTTFTNALWLE